MIDPIGGRVGKGMDYYQGVVVEYLRADRSIFVNTECCIQLDSGTNPDGGGPGRHWYCDAVAIDLEIDPVTTYLVEVSYAKKLSALLKRLTRWNEHWGTLTEALRRDCKVRPEWRIRPWLFVPTRDIEHAVVRIRRIGGVGTDSSRMPWPLITPLEMVTPWEYQSWNRNGENEAGKPNGIPTEMRQ
jgi:hypothetical protein